MSWVFRPAVLIGVSLLLVAVAVLLAWDTGGNPGSPRPAPVPSGSAEIAWLYPATSAASWERLVAGVKQAAERIGKEQPGIVAIEVSADSSGTVPEVALRWQGQNGTQQLLFRWYKLTSAWTADGWVDALTRRGPPPLAVISGSSSYWAREVALALQSRESNLPEESRPLLLLTTATADKVSMPDAHDGIGSGDEEGSPQRLNDVYMGRTYRFCFTNRQMATAITRFVWEQPELKPDGDPAFLVEWTDDSYSLDLFAGYQRVLNWRATDGVIRDAAFPIGLTARGLAPFANVGLFAPGFWHTGSVQLRIESGVGPFSSPNPYEARAVRELLLAFGRGPQPRRPLLAVTGQAGPTRRFLRDLARSAPLTSRRFVVVTGDAISFDTVYRDRLVSWPVQDLPFDLVFFCHYDPTSRVDGFDPNTGVSGGTESLLLYRHIALSLAEASRVGGTLCRTASDLKEGLEGLEWDGQPLFDKSPRRRGMRLDGTGECIVRVQPEFDGERALPRASIQVWKRGPPDQPDEWIVAHRLNADHAADPDGGGRE